MSDIVLVIAVYLGIGVVWLSIVIVKTVSKRQFEYVARKELIVRIVAWPWVFPELKLWWLALLAAATIGATAFAGVGALDSSTSQATSFKSHRSFAACRSP